jgi:hypothetical protein
MAKPGEVRQDAESGSVALRTGQKGGLAWLVANTNGGVQYVSSAMVDGWPELRRVDHVGPLGV